MNIHAQMDQNVHLGQVMLFRAHQDSFAKILKVKLRN